MLEREGPELDDTAVFGADIEVVETVDAVVEVAKAVDMTAVAAVAAVEAVVKGRGLQSEQRNRSPCQQEQSQR